MQHCHELFSPARPVKVLLRTTKTARRKCPTAPVQMVQNSIAMTGTCYIALDTANALFIVLLCKENQNQCVFN